MKNGRKLLLSCAAVICITLFTNCFSPWQGDTGYISISFGDTPVTGIRSAVFDIGNEEWNSAGVNAIKNGLRHTITLTGETGTKTFVIDKGKTSVKIPVPPGKWDILVEADYAGIPFAETIDLYSVDVKAGSNKGVVVQMWPGNTLFHTVGSAGEWDTMFNSGYFFHGYYHYVVLTGNITGVNGSVNCPFPSGNMVTIIGNGFSVTAASSTNNRLLYISSASVTIKDLHLKGHPGHSTSLVNIDSGTLIMESNSTISGNSSAVGVSIATSGGTLRIDSGIIYGNEPENAFPNYKALEMANNNAIAYIGNTEIYGPENIYSTIRVP